MFNINLSPIVEAFIGVVQFYPQLEWNETLMWSPTVEAAAALNFSDFSLSLWSITWAGYVLLRVRSVLPKA